MNFSFFAPDDFIIIIFKEGARLVERWWKEACHTTALFMMCPHAGALWARTLVLVHVKVYAPPPFFPFKPIYSLGITCLG